MELFQAISFWKIERYETFSNESDQKIEIYGFIPN